MHRNTLQFIFHDKHIFFPAIDPNEKGGEPTCYCISCKIKRVLLPKICLVSICTVFFIISGIVIITNKEIKLFFIGLLFPPIYFIIWGWKIYALLAYKRELNEANPFKMRGAKEGEEHDPEVEDDDISTLRCKDPFSDKYEIGKQDSNQTVQYSQKENEGYNFDAHCSINNRFDKWCGRSLIAFLCQVCLIIVITCAVIFANEGRHANLNM